MNNFFEKIIYSSSNEDGFSEIKALEINNNDVILSITGSGSRSLDLLLGNPKKVVSIDFNKTQNYLLKLKIAGYKYLNYEDFLSLMGINNKNKSFFIFESIKKYLDEETRVFFEKNNNLFKNGIIYSGVWEKINISLSKLFFFKKGKIKNLFDSQSIQEQEKIWKKHFDTFFFKCFIKLLTSRFLWINIIKEPGAKLIKKDFNISCYMLIKLRKLMNISLLKENDFANLIFFGYYKYSLPIHLKKDYFEIIKQNIYKIEIVDGSILDYVKNKSKVQEITSYSLSDFCSYATDDFYKSIWENIVNNSQNGSKFCERQYLVKQNPERFFSEIKRNNILEKEIEKIDKAFIYTFCIGKVNK